MISLGVLASAQAASAPNASVYYVTSAASASTLVSSWTFSSVALGDAEDRTVLVAVGTSIVNGGVLTCTVAGEATTIDVQNGGLLPAASIYRLTLPAATTSGDIVLTCSSTNIATYIHVYAINSDVTVVATDTHYKGSTATSFTNTLTTADGGFAIAVTGIRSNSAGASHVWTGVSENADLNLASGTSSSAHADTTGANLTAAVTLSGGSSLRFGGLAVATYEPA